MPSNSSSGETNAEMPIKNNLHGMFMKSSQNILHRHNDWLRAMLCRRNRKILHEKSCIFIKYFKETSLEQS